jgi:hypothetical protein
VALGDVDADGNLDAVFADDGPPNQVCLGTGAGTFNCSTFGPIASSSGVALAPVKVANSLNEPGSLLVFPVVNNLPGGSSYKTIVEIANLSDRDVWVKCYMIMPEGEPPLKQTEKKNFVIHITQKEPFFWNTSQRYSRKDASGVLTQIGDFDALKGFMFCWAIDNEKNQNETDFDFLKGDALIYHTRNGQAWQYNAIPHQGIAVVGKGVLNLDGFEYSSATSTIYFEGFAEGVNGVEGTLHVANLDINFITSEQPGFDINMECWNQNEVPFSRHLQFRKDRSYEQYDLTEDLQLSTNDIFTAKFQCNTLESIPRPLWAVFEERTGGYAWATNVFQNPNSQKGTKVVLP